MTRSCRGIIVKPRQSVAATPDQGRLSGTIRMSQRRLTANDGKADLLIASASIRALPRSEWRHLTARTWSASVRSVTNSHAA